MTLFLSCHQPPQVCPSQKWRFVSLRLFIPTQLISECSATSEILTSQSKSLWLFYLIHLTLKQMINDVSWFSDLSLWPGNLTLLQSRRKQNLRWPLWSEDSRTVRQKSLKSKSYDGIGCRLIDPSCYWHMSVCCSYPSEWGGVVDGKPYLKNLEDFRKAVLEDLWTAVKEQFIEVVGYWNCFIIITNSHLTLSLYSSPEVSQTVCSRADKQEAHSLMNSITGECSK